MAELGSLREKIASKRRIGSRQVARLIRAKEKTTLFPQRLATLAVAHDNGISITAYATPEELGQLRESRRIVEAGPAAPPPASRSRNNRRRRAQTKRPSPSVGGEGRVAVRPDTRRRRVIVVHGRDEEVRKDLFRLLRSLDLLPIEWSKAILATGKGAPTIGDILDALFANAAAVVVLLTPDDLVSLSSRLRKTTDPPYESEGVGQPRPNVFYEAGLAVARFRDSTVFVKVGKVKVPSDIDAHVTRLTNSSKSRHEFMTKLRAAGCDVDTEGSEWLTEGDFEKEETDAKAEPR